MLFKAIFIDELIPSVSTKHFVRLISLVKAFFQSSLICFSSSNRFISFSWSIHGKNWICRSITKSPTSKQIFFDWLNFHVSKEGIAAKTNTSTETSNVVSNMLGGRQVKAIHLQAAALPQLPSSLISNNLGYGHLNYQPNHTLLNQNISVYS